MGSHGKQVAFVVNPWTECTVSMGEVARPGQPAWGREAQERLIFLFVGGLRTVGAVFPLDSI